LLTNTALEPARIKVTDFSNNILRALSHEDAQRLTERGGRVDLALGQRLYEPGDRVEWVYFPEGSLLSLVVSTEDGRTAESGMVGFEGAMGLVEACGSGVIALTCIVQSPGPAWRVPVAACRALAAEAQSFRAVVWRMLEFQLVESRQSATCRSFHPVERRLARWLLECRDRDGAQDVMPVTQEFMGDMLGVQRTTVNSFAKLLQSQGLIDYSRGRVRFVDVEGLEAAACECRSVLVRERERLTAA
jgi:CRP-like cAMP-binding protein